MGCGASRPDSVCPRQALAARLDRRLNRWRSTQEVPPFEKLRFKDPFKEQYVDHESNRFGGQMGAYVDNVVSVPGLHYINATPLDNLEKGDLRWIATMCPKKQTTEHFWNMIWHKEVKLIVNLTGPHDTLGSGLSHKREKYWPPFSFEGTQEGWPVQVETKSVETLANELFIAKITVVVKDVSSGETREVDILWYVNWIDNGQESEICSRYFLENCRVVLLLAQLVADIVENRNAENDWAVVHCSAGVGRTGTFITLVSLLRSLPEIPDVRSLDFSVWSRIERLRQRRLWMVKNAFEYATIFGVVMLELRYSRHVLSKWDPQSVEFGADADWNARGSSTPLYLGTSPITPSGEDVWPSSPYGVALPRPVSRGSDIWPHPKPSPIEEASDVATNSPARSANGSFRSHGQSPRQAFGEDDNV